MNFDCTFWRSIAQRYDLGLVDNQFIALTSNGYHGSNTDMFAQWRDAGFPDLTPFDEL